MKKVTGYIVAALIGFVVGGATGWLARKKTAEVQFEVLDIQKDDFKRPLTTEDIKNAINESFTLSEDAKKAIEHDLLNNDDANVVVTAVDTQKEQYFKKWKAEEALEKYDTRTKEEPEDPVVSEDLEEGFDADFLEEAGKEEYDVARPEIEAGSMEDWDHWMTIKDGDYDCVEVYWFAGDNVLTDSDGDPIDNPGRSMGFDVSEKFREIDPDTTGDPDIRIIYNHKHKTIYQIIRRQGSYARKVGMEEFGSDYDGDDEEL